MRASIDKINQLLNSKKTITISILPEVKPGMRSIDFISLIEEKIYNELKIID